MEGICNLDTSVVKGCRLIRAQFGIKIYVFPKKKRKKKKVKSFTETNVKEIADNDKRN